MEWLAEWHRFTERHSAAFLVLLTATLVLALNGCLPKSPTGFSRFDHKQHIETAEDDEEKALFNDCKKCHAGTAEAGADVRAEHEICLDCHDFDMDAPDEECLVCHELPKVDGELPSGDLLESTLKKIYADREEARKKRLGERIWNHSRVEGKVECKVCHGDVRIGRPWDPFEYHRDHGSAEDCATCHETNRREIAPRDHAEPRSWTLRHGPLSRSRQEPACNACHQRAFCDDCHRGEKPRDHTAMFRNRGHGFFAEGNRRRCAACHEQNSCEACHQQSEPRSHTAGFKRRGHCRSCHEQSTTRGSRCKVCHKLDIGQHRTVRRPVGGRQLHDLPQGFGQRRPQDLVSPLGSDCKICHDFTQW